MKKRLIFVLCLLLSALITGAAGETALVKTGNGSLNLRREPGKNADVAAYIPDGATVEVLESAVDGWLKVGYKGREGYVMAQFVSLGETGEEVKLYTNTGGFAFLRESESDDARLITVITRVMPITVLSYGEQWAKVSTVDAEGQTFTGYMRSSAISQNRAEPASDAGGAIYMMNAAATLTSEQKLYEWPDSASASLVTLPKDTAVVVQRAEGAWSYVLADVYVGYVRSSAVKLTGQAAPKEDYSFVDYTASYYTASAPSGEIKLYAEPTGQTVTGAFQTLAVPADTQLTVLRRGESFGGAQWSLVSDGKTTGWTPSGALVFSDTRQTYEYPVIVSSSAAGVAYAKACGARMFADASALSELLLTVPEGEEVSVTLRSGYASATYGGRRGYIPLSDLELGFVDVPGWSFAGGVWDESVLKPTAASQAQEPALSRGDARVLADAALSAAFPAFSAEGMETACELYTRKGALIGPFYEFAYYREGRYQYLCAIHADTGKTLRTADYTDFTPTYTDAPTAAPAPDPAQEAPRKDEISASSAREIADGALKAAYENFGDSVYAVGCERVRSKPGYEGPFYQFDYYVGDYCVFICMVRCDTGKVIYHSNTWDPNLTEIDYNTPTPAPVYESTEDIGQSAARAIADGALKGKYPEFAGFAIDHVNVRFAPDAVDFASPYYQFDYYDAQGTFTYCCIVHAWTGKVLYTTGSLPGEGNG